MDLDKVKLGVSTLTDEAEVYLYRHGKDPRVALDKREAMADVFRALVELMTHDAPDGSEMNVTLDGQRWWQVTVKRTVDPATVWEGEDS